MRIAWTVEHDPNGTPTVIDDVQEITCFVGKRKISDTRRPSSAIITGRNAAALPTITLYDEISIAGKNVVDNYQYFGYSGVVVDFNIDYGFVASQDRWTITLNSNENSLATTLFSGGSLTAGDTLDDAVLDFIFNIPGVTGAVTSSLPDLRTSAVTLTGKNVVEVLDTFANTGALQWGVSADGQQLYFVGPYLYGGFLTFNFTDDGSGTNPIIYDRLKFNSLADNYAPVIEIDPDTGSTVTVGSGRRTETFSTYSFNTNEATSLAQYYELLYSADGIAPNEVSFIWSTIPGNAQFVDPNLGQVFDITFRSTTYETVAIGLTFTATPDDVRSTFYLAPASITNYLVLDETVFGQLDSNRLGL